MTNTSELLINAVMIKKPKVLTGFNQKVCGRLFQMSSWDTRTIRPSVNRQGLTHLVNQVKHGKPVSLPSGQANRKEC